MEISFSERYIVGLNVILIALMAYFAALAVDDAIALRLSGGQTERPVAQQTARPAAAVNHPRSYYDAVVKRDIFNLRPETEAAPAPAVSEDLHIKLLGTSHLTLAKPFAVIEDQSGNESLYRLGDDIPGAGKLAEVRESSVVIEHEGRRVLVKIPQELVSEPLMAMRPFGGSPARSHSRFGGKGVRRIGSNRYMLSRSTVDSSLQNMAKLFTEIRAIPNFQNGTSNGFRLSEIQSGSIFQQIGLRDGDVLVSVEGQPINDPAKAMELLGNLRNRDSISLNVIRDGEPVNLTYTIR
jgi:general secretion pathway protein C